MLRGFFSRPSAAPVSIRPILRRTVRRLVRFVEELSPWDVVLAVLVALVGLALDGGFSRSFVLTCLLLPLARTAPQPFASLVALISGFGYSLSEGTYFQPWIDPWANYASTVMWCLPPAVAGWYVGRKLLQGWSLLVVVLAALVGTTPYVATPLPAVTLLVAYAAGRLWTNRDQRLGVLSRQLGAARLQVETTQDEKVGLQERNELARDLHDIIGHHLSVISLSTEAAHAQPATTEQALRQIRTASNAALNELDVLLHSLRRSGDADLEPYKGLNDVAELLTPLRQADVQVDCQVLVLTTVTDGLQLTAYRIVQEAVTNILRHAGASRATIAIATTTESLTIEVADDGAGFDREAVTRGRGLAGIEERVRSFSGHWSVGTSQWGGTRIEVDLPLTTGEEPQ